MSVGLCQELENCVLPPQVLSSLTPQPLERWTIIVSNVSSGTWLKPAVIAAHCFPALISANFSDIINHLKLSGPLQPNRISHGSAWWLCWVVFQQVMLRWGWGWSHEDSGAICRRGALVSLLVDIPLPGRSSCVSLESKRTAWRTSSGVVWC